MTHYSLSSQLKLWSKQVWTMISTIMGSRWFFWLVIAFFIFETVWIALSAIYPMLFDEEYHLGIIEIYSRQLSPFITTQPPEAAFHGDITRYGSYLFHYLMSLPYWLVSHITQDLMTQIIALRFICISFVVAGLIMWRKVLLRLNVSPFVVNSAITIFALLPIVPFALSQLNYDSLAFLLVPLLMYFGIRATESKDTKQAVWLWLFLALAPLACLVKFTLLPVVLAVFIFILFSLWKGVGIKKSFHTMKRQIKALPRITLIFLSIFLLLGGGLFLERYGTNLVLYRAIEPKCDRVHSSEECIQYTVWRRDNSWKQKNDVINKERDNPLVYTATYWIPHIFSDFFVVAAFVYDQDQPLEIRYLPTNMQASAGTFVLKYGSWFILVGAIVSIFLTRKYLWRQYKNLVIITILIFGIYSISLWIRNYTDYLQIGTPTAAQGRYFVPLLIPLLAIAGIAYAKALRHLRYKLLFTLLVVVMLIQGGGVASYILYSNQKWYWLDQRKTISQVNSATRKVLQTFIVR